MKSVCLFLLFIMLSLSSRANESIITGLWYAEFDDSLPKTTIDLIKNDNNWVAITEEGSKPLVFSETVNQLLIEFDNGARLEIDKSDFAQTKAGFLIEPSSPLGYQEMITKVNVKRDGETAYRVSVSGQPRRYRLYLDVFKGQAGELVAVLRNPERNEIQNATKFTVIELHPGTWTLVSSRDRSKRHSNIQILNKNQLLLEHVRFSAPVVMNKATSVQKAGYYPRIDGHVANQSTIPEKLDDGWKVGRASESGFDAEKLNSVINTLASAETRGMTPQMIHALLVAKGDTLIIEEYFFGHQPEDAHDIRSLGKVFAPSLLGAYRLKDPSIGPNTLSMPTDKNPNRASITLSHLMSYTSGLDCDDNRDSPGNEFNLWKKSQNMGFWNYTKSLPQIHEPGSKYAYCSASINLVGQTLTDLSGESIITLFDELIAKPLQFSAYHWNLMPNNDGYLGGGAFMRPRDVLKVGAAHINLGKWNDVQVFPTDWMEIATQPVIDISPKTTALSEEQFANLYFPGEQALSWIKASYSLHGSPVSVFTASGNGGQLLVLIPQYEISAVLKGGNYNMGFIWGRWVGDILINGVMDAYKSQVVERLTN